MTRSEALKKLLCLGDLTQPEIEVIMGGDKLVLRDAMFGSLAAGDITYRNAGVGQRVWTLTPTARAALGGANA